MAVIPTAVVVAVAAAATDVVNHHVGGPDYVGIAAVITALSGFVGTIGMLILTAMRQRNEDQRPRRRR